VHRAQFLKLFGFEIGVSYDGWRPALATVENLVGVRLGQEAELNGRLYRSGNGGG